MTQSDMLLPKKTQLSASNPFADLWKGGKKGLKGPKRGTYPVHLLSHDFMHVQKCTKWNKKDQKYTIT